MYEIGDLGLSGHIGSVVDDNCADYSLMNEQRRDRK
jgi:hypothetical protein